MFKKILIANRGEIAVRVIKTCQRLGVKTVAVHSELDFRSPYVEAADEAVFIGGARASESYLDAGKIVSAALDHECEAIHPGYGFLSENSRFAEMIAEAGIEFIGPPPKAIAVLGDKTASKSLAIQAGVPVVPGYEGAVTDLDHALSVADEIGFPVLVKPAAGGGGRGMRIVRSRDELPQALSLCKEETRKSFGDDRVFVERYVERPRHIEVQIMADKYGNVVHLGERECSVQRRYQKVIEETPSPAVDDRLRGSMGAVACALAKRAGYVNAGTVEFILAPDGNFYFLEMNTRLQVEHPVTEMITDLDLVELQLRIAEGDPLPFTQEQVTFRGHAIEVRVCAEDPARGFVPTTGMITRYAAPKSHNVRVDSGIAAGSLISIYYDSLLAKVITWGDTREDARKTMVRALNGYHIEGPSTNVDFANAVLTHPAFIAGDLSTAFIEEHFPDGRSLLPCNAEHLNNLVIASVLVYHTRRHLVRESLKPLSPLIGTTPEPKLWHDYVVRVDDAVHEIKLEGETNDHRWFITISGVPFEVVTPEFEYYRRRLLLKINGESQMFRLQYDANHIKAFHGGLVKLVEIYTPREWAYAAYMPKPKEPVIENALRCPMPGLVTAVSVADGDLVRKGQELVRMESMKMEAGIASPCDARVDKALVAPGQTVDTDEILITFKT